MVISNFLAGAVGNYFVQVSNAVGTVQSTIAAIQIAAQTNKGTTSTPTTLLVDKFGDAVDLTAGSTAEHYRPEDGGGETGGFTLSQSFSTVGATKEAGEPNHCRPAGRGFLLVQLHCVPSPARSNSTPQAAPLTPFWPSIPVPATASAL